MNKYSFKNLFLLISLLLIQIILNQSIIVWANDSSSSLSSSSSLLSIDNHQSEFPKQKIIDSTTKFLPSASNFNNKQLNYYNNDKSIIKQINGQQFINLFDQLMNGEITRIINQIKNKNDKFNLIEPNKLIATEYISLLDNYSSGDVSRKLDQIFSSSSSSSNIIRNRRSSFDSMTGLSIGYPKRRFDPMIGSTFGHSSLKRGINFDEMDHSGFASFAKRYSSNNNVKNNNNNNRLTNYLLRKKFFDFDEIDRSGFNSFSKRSTINFDEMDHSGFSNFQKRLINNDNYDDNDIDDFDQNQYQLSLLLNQLLNKSKKY